MAATDNNQVNSGSLLGELVSFSLYKWNQGRIARQVTFAALAVVVGLGAWNLARLIADRAASAQAADPYGLVRFVLPGVLLAAAFWFCFRVVNVPRFAEFLIAVEAEMAKVSWPTGQEVFRSSFVVIFLIFALAAILYAYDLAWTFLLDFVR